MCCIPKLFFSCTCTSRRKRDSRDDGREDGRSSITTLPYTSSTTLPTLTPLPSTINHSHPSSGLVLQSSHQELGLLRSLTIIAVCVIGFMITSMSSLAIYLVVPLIDNDMDISAADLQWIYSGFTLGYGSCVLIAGKLADIYGHKRFLLIGFACYCAFSLGSALAQTFYQIAIFRVIQGICAASTTPSLLAILARTFPVGSKMRIEAFAIFSTGSPLGSAIGLLVGGPLIERTGLGWRAFFYFSLVMSGIAFITTSIFLPNDPPKNLEKLHKKVDWIGAIAVMGGLFMLVASLSISSIHGWTSARVLAPFFVSIVLLLGFGFWEWYLEKRDRFDPLMNVTLFRNRRYAGVQCVAGLLWLSYRNINYFYIQYFQNYLNESITRTVVQMLPILVMGLLLILVTGWLAERLKAQSLIIFGALALAVSLSLIKVACLISSLMHPAASYWSFSVVSITFSVIGGDFVFAIGSLYGMTLAKPSDQSHTAATFLMFTRVISSVGLGISILIQLAVTQAESLIRGVDIGTTSTSAPAPAYLLGLRAGWWFCFGSAALATLISVTCLRGMGYIHPHHNVKEIKTSEETSQISVSACGQNELVV